MGQSAPLQEQKIRGPEAQSVLMQQIKQILGSQDIQKQAYEQFFGNEGGKSPFQEEAIANFKNTTIPAIKEAYGTNFRRSTGLDTQLAKAGENLNRGLASDNARYQLAAAEGRQKQINSILGIPEFGLQAPAPTGLQTAGKALAEYGPQIGETLLTAYLNSLNNNKNDTPGSVPNTRYLTPETQQATSQFFNYANNNSSPSFNIRPTDGGYQARLGIPF